MVWNDQEKMGNEEVLNSWGWRENDQEKQGNEEVLNNGKDYIC